MTNTQFGCVMDALIWLAAVLLVLVGIMGTILPAIPGVPLVFGGLALAAWIDQFRAVSVWTLVVLGVLTLLSFVLDFVSTMLGAKRVGASKRGLFGAMAGTLVGIFFGLPGLILGPFIGAVAGELSLNPDLYRAGKVGLGAWLGLLLGVAAKLTVVFLMIGIFVTAYII